ncbi:hypothetical protein SDRG_12292 [Saprolegnia diclina VS20]|uniref:PX domain-containing protein n=1 Tax=Saprolegnia diclina (strain VS20) TaxID=1156394 RepID=T0RJI7_SAPDV|nr:hypothetical protein SDRG_12292 [Saprolegnia diclina VS20]EQC30012.1 hypothetical protein SDRG_12292 [Saprolegnia diclina VS20]|eukprot:XP_008616579.1 hypothetical protein SDRG_12292 [Saprolegnia diclina VS20]
MVDCEQLANSAYRQEEAKINSSMYGQFSAHRSYSLAPAKAVLTDAPTKAKDPLSTSKKPPPSKEKKRATTIDYEMTVGDDVAQAYHDASIAMELPQPYVMELNKNFVVVENCAQLTTLLSAAPIRAQPLGYYRTSDGFDMYVFECTLGATPVEKRSWKIHRRYRHFDAFLAQLNTLAPSMRFPSLSGSYLQMFRAKQCADRLVELHAWLEKVFGLLQAAQAAQSLPAPSKANPHAKLFVLLCSFLFAGANTPYISSTAPTLALPAFAWSYQQVTIRLTQTPLYPSKVRSSIESDAGLGLRLAPAHRAKEETITVYRGALVQAFLRHQVDTDLQHVRLGSHLTHINGVSVEDEEFTSILFQLRSMARPMQLTFRFDPRPHHFEDEMPERDRLSSIATSDRANSVYMAGGSVDVTEPQTPMRVFESVFSDTFGRKRTDTVQLPDDVNEEVESNQDDVIESWDDVGGFVMDTISHGYFFAKLHGAPAKAKPTDTAFATGIWSTAAGPMSVQFTGCRLRGKDAVYLSATPMLFNAPEPKNPQRKQERRLERGMVLTAVNKESTFGRSFKDVVKLLETASQPTALTFRWFTEYSLFLGPNLDAVDQTLINRHIRDDPTPTPTELNSLLEAQAKMFRSLQTALNENASLRKDMQVIQESNRLVREDHASALSAYKGLLRANERLVERCQALQYALEDVHVDVQQTAKERRAAEAAAATAAATLSSHLEKARVDSVHYLKAHEARCLAECNKSIEVAKRVAEAKTKKQVDDAVAALRAQTNAAMQRLVEENADEIEFLNQQLALWKHQVEVLTESDRREHASSSKQSKTLEIPEDALLREMEQLHAQDRRAGSRVRSASNAGPSTTTTNSNSSTSKGGNSASAAVPKPSVWDRVLDSMIGD